MTSDPLTMLKEPQTEGLIAQLFDNQPDAVVWYRPVIEGNETRRTLVDLEIQYVNHTAARLLGVSRSQVLGEHLRATALMDQPAILLIFTQCQEVWKTDELTIAQNNLPGYSSKAVDAVSDAQTSAQKSSDQAYKATNGDLGDAKTAKKKAKKALNDAEDASDAKDNVKDQEKKIDKLTAQLEKKQKQLAELEEMRTTIRLMHQ